MTHAVIKADHVMQIVFFHQGTLCQGVCRLKIFTVVIGCFTSQNKALNG